MSELFQTIEPWADAWGASLWRASWQGGLVIIAAWAIARCCTFLSPRVACWIWRLACLKLLVALVWVQPVAVAILPSVPPPKPETLMRIETAAPRIPVATPILEKTPRTELGTAVIPQRVPPNSQVGIGTIVMLLWGTCVFCFVLVTIKTWVSMRRLCRSAAPVSSGLLQRAFAGQADWMEIRRHPHVRLSPRVESPLLTGVWQPTIVLPDGAEQMFDEIDVRLMFGHELAHLQRRDLIWNWLPTVVGWLFFFHPLVWVLKRSWFEAQEAACDELVIQKNVARPSEYGRLLLKLATRCPKEPRAGLAAAGVLGDYRDLERRIVAMTRVKTASHRRLLTAAGALSLVAALGIVPWRLVAAEPAETPATQFDARDSHNLPSLDSIVKHQAHLESLLKSCSAEFDVVCVPTKDDSVPLIKEVIRTQFRDLPPDPRIGRGLKQDEYQRYLISQHDADIWSYSARWNSDGTRELIEHFPIGKIGQGEPHELFAFDGKVVRELYNNPKPKRAIIESIDQAHWNSYAKLSPYTMLVECHGQDATTKARRKESRVMQDATDFSVRPLSGEGPGAFEVTFSDKDTSRRYVLQFDKQLRIVQREWYWKSEEDKKQRLWERHLFSEWEDHRLDSGDVISFPKKCRITYVVGVTDGGQLAIWQEEMISFDSIEFNPRLDESLFTIEFPAGIPVEDRTPSTDRATKAEQASEKAPLGTDEQKAASRTGQKPSDARDEQGSEMLREIRRKEAPLLAAMAKEYGYRLEPNQSLRLITPPFPAIRMEWYRVGEPGQAQAIPAGPTAIVFRWSNDQLANQGTTMTFSGSNPLVNGHSLAGLLDALLKIKKNKIEGPRELLEKTIPGDWVIRSGASDEQVVKELAAILRKELALRVRLEFRNVDRPVYVAEGVYSHKSVPRGRDKDTTILTDRTVTSDAIEIFGKQLVPNSGAGGGLGKFSEFLDWLGDWIGTPIVSDVKAPPQSELSWFLHGRSPFTKEMEAEDHDPALVLANITAQTGLTFRKETRTVRILFVDRAK